MLPWEEKLSNLVGAISLEAYRKANKKKDGTYYKKHRPYTLPPIVDELVTISGMKDREVAEILAKRIFITLADFEVGQIVREGM